MVAVSDERGGADSLVLDNIVHQASSELMNVMRAKYDPSRSDYLLNAKELARLAQSIDLGRGSLGREFVAAHVPPKRRDTRTRFCCGRTGRVVSDCKPRVAFDHKTSNKSGDMVLTLTEKSVIAHTKGAKSKKKKKKNLRGKAARASNASGKVQLRPTWTASCQPQMTRLASIEMIEFLTAVRADAS